jgi:transcriptional regulator with XRE-family HTH domain
MKTRIRNLREDNDLTQAQLGKLLNISQVAYSYYELNKRSIPLELLSSLADYYNTSIDYLLYRTDEPAPYPKSSAKSSTKAPSVASVISSDTTPAVASTATSVID